MMWEHCQYCLEKLEEGFGEGCTETAPAARTDSCGISVGRGVDGGKGKRDSGNRGRGQGGGGHEEHRNPFTKLDRLVNDGAISIPIIENMFKAFVAIGDYEGHVGLDVKCSRAVDTAIRGAVNLDKLSIIPASGFFWGNEITRPHILSAGKEI